MLLQSMSTMLVLLIYYIFYIKVYILLRITAHITVWYFPWVLSVVWFNISFMSHDCLLKVSSRRQPYLIMEECPYFWECLFDLHFFVNCVYHLLMFCLRLFQSKFHFWYPMELENLIFFYKYLAHAGLLFLYAFHWLISYPVIWNFG